jgi:hypothetical protein
VEAPSARRPQAVVWTDARVAVWRATGQRPAVAVWTAAQTAAFLAHVRGHVLYPLFHVAALLGLRRGEVIGLRWSTGWQGAPLLSAFAAGQRPGALKDAITALGATKVSFIALPSSQFPALRVGACPGGALQWLLLSKPLGNHTCATRGGQADAGPKNRFGKAENHV